MNENNTSSFVILPNSEIKKRRLENDEDRHVPMEQHWEADVRPITDVEIPISVFKYKLVNELYFPLQPFRTATANRQWYVATLVPLRTAKRHLCHTFLSRCFNI